MILLGELVLIMALLARASGGWLREIPDRLGFLPEAIFASIFALAFREKYPDVSTVWIALIGGWTYYSMETGIGTALAALSGDASIARGGRKQFLSRFVDPLCKLFRQPLGGTFYGVALFAIKGLMIGAALFPFGLALGVLWPACYYIGKGKIRGTPGGVFCEIASGACAGLVIWAFLTYG